MHARPSYVLIVDDLAEVRKLFALYVREAGHRSILAANAEEALEQIQQHGVPRLILLDVMMPEMDGMEFARVLREMPELSSTRIVGVSALAFKSDRTAALEAGMDEYLTKPLSSDEAIGKIRQWMSETEG